MEFLLYNYALVDRQPATKTRPFTTEEWSRVIERNDIDNVSQKRLRDSLVHGIPSELRGEVWALLTKSRQLSIQFSEYVYHKLIEQLDTNVKKQINKDIHRTFPTHKLFREQNGIGRQRLYNILAAYSSYDPTVGYCQGMGFIVGCLVTYIDDEMLAFWTFVQIMFNLNWRLMFRENWPKLKWIITRLESDMTHYFPEVLTHIEAEELSVLSCFAQNIISVFLYDTPFDISCRIMDLFLFEGEGIVKVLLLKMLSLKKEKILSLSGMRLYEYLKLHMVIECFTEYQFETLVNPYNADEETEFDMEELS